MTRATNEQAEAMADTGAAPETDAEIAAAIYAPAPDPTRAGMDALTAAGHEPLKIWTVKGPKDIGGTLSAVFLQATSEVVILHQLAGGKFGVFRKGEV